MTDDLHIERFGSVELRESIGFQSPPARRDVEIERSTEAYDQPGSNDLWVTGGPRSVRIPAWWGAWCHGLITHNEMRRINGY